MTRKEKQAEMEYLAATGYVLNEAECSYHMYEMFHPGATRDQWLDAMNAAIGAQRLLAADELQPWER